MSSTPSPRSLLALAFATLTSVPALADVVSYSTTAGPIPVGSTGSATLPRFDASLGVLRSARVSALASVSGTWGVENTAAHADGVGGYGGGEYIGLNVPVGLPAGYFLGVPSPAFLPDPNVPLAAFDGTTDYAGPSGTTFVFTNEYGDGGPGQTANIYMDAELAAYVGAGSFPLTIATVTQVGPNIPPWFQSTATLTANVWLTVQYTYEPAPTAICRAQPWSGCPCNNPSTNGRGCGNSAGPLGGALQASGVASLSADTLLLSGSGMTNSSALYFQGSTFGYVQTVYGDGLRCVTGNVVRLGTKTNAAGISQYPVGSDLPVSVRGGVAAPGHRYYQVIYRDGGNFCTASQFNGTSGVAILWSP